MYPTLNMKYREVYYVSNMKHEVHSSYVEPPKNNLLYCEPEKCFMLDT
jgi:hypothetical protein